MYKQNVVVEQNEAKDHMGRFKQACWQRMQGFGLARTEQGGKESKGCEVKSVMQADILTEYR